MASNIMPNSFGKKSSILSKNLIEKFKSFYSLQEMKRKKKCTKVKYLSNNLKHKVLDWDYEIILYITDKTKEKKSII